MPRWARNRVNSSNASDRKWRLKCTRICQTENGHTEFRRIFLELKLSPGNGDRMTVVRLLVPHDRELEICDKKNIILFNGLMHSEAAFLRSSTRCPLSVRLSTMHEYCTDAYFYAPKTIFPENYIPFELAIKKKLLKWNSFGLATLLTAAARHGRRPPHQFPTYFMWPMHWNYLRSIRVARNRPSRIYTIFEFNSFFFFFFDSSLRRIASMQQNKIKIWAKQRTPKKKLTIFFVWVIWDVCP